MTARTATYENRKGDTYYIHAKATKTGAMTYYATKRRDANKALDAMPDGFEFYESPLSWRSPSAGCSFQM